MMLIHGNIPLLLLGVFLVAFSTPVFSQITIEEEENEIAEPLVRDNTTDIGSEAGSIEFNLIPTWGRRDEQRERTQGIEVEYTLLEGLGIEAEVSHRQLSLASGEKEYRFGQLELGLQYTPWQQDRWALALGIEAEAPLRKEEDWGWAPFAVLAWQWSDNWSSQLGTSPEWEMEEAGAELAWASQASLLYQWRNALVGFELLGDYEDEWALGIAPQVSWAWGAWSVGAAWALPLTTDDGNHNFLLRLIYEIELK